MIFVLIIGAVTGFVISGISFYCGYKVTEKEYESLVRDLLDCIMDTSDNDDKKEVTLPPRYTLE